MGKGILHIVWVVICFIVGLVLSGLVQIVLLTNGLPMDMLMLITYPVMFIPTLLYVYIVRKSLSCDFSQSLSLKSEKGKDNIKASLIAICMTFLLGYITDLVNSILPPMSEAMKQALELATGGRFWCSLLSVAIMAPILEEWLCRGLILNGLRKCGCNAVISIVLSALFFALIHGNLWQAVPAFILGALFGYVYVRTGKLWLCMLMHFANNFLSLILSRIESISETETWLSLLGDKLYFSVLPLVVLLFALGIRFFERKAKKVI